jgi:hypothetical protein
MVKFNVRLILQNYLRHFQHGDENILSRACYRPKNTRCSRSKNNLKKFIKRLDKRKCIYYNVYKDNRQYRIIFNKKIKFGVKIGVKNEMHQTNAMSLKPAVSSRQSVYINILIMYKLLTADD